MKHIIGVDIGGTTCALTYTQVEEMNVTFIDKVEFDTIYNSQTSIEKFFEIIDSFISKHNIQEISAIGISCGGPLNGKTGIIINPPNLPGWENTEIVRIFKEKYDCPIALKNDANAGALAEWFWGSAKDKDNVIFLTFGTGMGSGLILNGRLYEGTNDLAGEVGHIRLASTGPWGFGKKGSFEGFCSGGGIKRLGQIRVAEWLTDGKNVEFCPSFSEIEHMSAKTIGIAAQNGDKHAKMIYKEMIEKLGLGISTLIDIINPEIVVLGSIYLRQKELIDEYLFDELKKESIDIALEVCEITQATLDEQIGDYAAIAIAMYHLNYESESI